MGMWKLKGCPRCGGDLLIEKDLEYGWHEACIQCSFSSELKEPVKSTTSSDSIEEAQITNQ
ncbi:hypothetical protein ACFLX7_00375 [Chloroflexota bacterium]